MTPTDANIDTRIHVEIKWKLVLQILSRLYDHVVDGLRESGQTDVIDTTLTVHQRVELTMGIMMIYRISPKLIL